MESKNGHLRVPTKLLLGLLCSALLGIGGYVYAREVRRIDALEQQIHAQQGSLTEIQTDVRWIKRYLSER